MTNEQDFKCPCSSGKAYRDCCSLYHQGKEPENALIVMCSRYSAYALNNVEYIVRTTHPRHPAVSQNLQEWKNAIMQFAMHTDFENLEILDTKEDNDHATAIFIAHLKQNGEDVSFTERSYFAKSQGKWLYVNGDVFPGENRELKVKI